MEEQSELEIENELCYRLHFNYRDSIDINITEAVDNIRLWGDELKSAHLRSYQSLHHDIVRDLKNKCIDNKFRRISRAIKDYIL